MVSKLKQKVNELTNRHTRKVREQKQKVRTNHNTFDHTGRPVPTIGTD